MTALLVGTLLAVIALTYVLYPLIQSGPVVEPLARPDSPRLSNRNQAIDALREIEFDRATGKLSDVDYDSLKASYTERAITEMRAPAGLVCERSSCVPRIATTDSGSLSFVFPMPSP